MNNLIKPYIKPLFKYWTLIMILKLTNVFIGLLPENNINFVLSLVLNVCSMVSCLYLLFVIIKLVIVLFINTLNKARNVTDADDNNKSNDD